MLELDTASRRVAELAGLAQNLSNPHLLISPFLRREAVLSSRIEGTQTSVGELYAFEAGGKPARADTQEVLNYVRALESGMSRLAELPICVRLVNELHAVLLEDARGSDQRPGELRRVQVWIGAEGTPIQDARYVPPPYGEIPRLLADWESFIHEDLLLPPLVRCALMHYQFEAIHPYRDGNGRIGRLLISLFLAESGLLPLPLLYLSAYFERLREQYYDELFEVTASGRWDSWLSFFLKGVAEQASDAIQRVATLNHLREQYRRVLQADRASGNTLQVIDDLFRAPVTTVARTAALLDVTAAGARGILSRLVAANVLRELDSYPRRYFADEILAAIQ